MGLAVLANHGDWLLTIPLLFPVADKDIEAREAKELAQGDTAGMWSNQELTPGSQSLESKLLTTPQGC